MQDLALTVAKGRTGTVGLVPADAASADYLATMKVGQGLLVKAKRARSLRQHRLYWALLSKVVENQEVYPTAEALLVALKIELGHVDLVADMRTGECMPHPKSIAFHAMGADQFRNFFDRSIDLIIAHVIPGTDRDALLAEVEAMVGERRAA